MYLTKYTSFCSNKGHKKLRSSFKNNRPKALIQMATGERVIIVMGAVNVMKPRVSGTLNKYILCIA